jgi:hypothetical protein
MRGKAHVIRHLQMQTQTWRLTPIADAHAHGARPVSIPRGLPMPLLARLGALVFQPRKHGHALLESLRSKGPALRSWA